MQASKHASKHLSKLASEHASLASTSNCARRVLKVRPFYVARVSLLSILCPAVTKNATMARNSGATGNWGPSLCRALHSGRGLPIIPTLGMRVGDRRAHQLLELLDGRVHHGQLEEALLNYQDWMDQKTNRPRLNPQVPNYLMNINKDPRLLPSTSTSTVNVDPVPNVQEKGVLCIPGCSHKSIQVKPTMVNRLVGARIFRKRKLLHSFEEESSEGHDPSTVGSTTEFSENESSSNLPIQKSLAGRQVIYWPTALNIKRNLPTAFTTSKEYANVQAIIDCFEIEIEKPKKPVDQALTWSQYKNCNTIKYLISATPDGFINFVSEGYGGRISDMYLVEQSGYLEIIPANATILADRGFKHLESHLVKKSVKVLRPPSVLKGTKMTKAEVIDSKILASLRIHIERVIRRVRLIKMLKPHAVVNNKLLNILDDAVVVACGLINLQSPVIRKY
ncbi:hypothetical protein MSG28_010391 [Choristoneura fumiferana]|uniref:Uncharacterized protein n=1 Tax=Choristoneura fumiferana TaxID=7141 RepID=A0ACC0KKT6_CHOFU|nr:hypothetical protein MSG28_010391 [Choristoneura fumiferana]